MIDFVTLRKMDMQALLDMARYGERAASHGLLNMQEWCCTYDLRRTESGSSNASKSYSEICKDVVADHGWCNTSGCLVGTYALNTIAKEWSRNFVDTLGGLNVMSGITKRIGITRAEAEFLFAGEDEKEDGITPCQWC